MIDSDLKILRIVATHPKIDLLKLLSWSDYDPYILCKRNLGISYRVCYSHLQSLEKMDLIGPTRFRYHISEKGRHILSRLDEGRALLND